ATITPTMNCSNALEKMSPAITSDAMPMRMVTIQPIGSEPGWKSRPSAPTRAPTMISNIQCIESPFPAYLEENAWEAPLVSDILRFGAGLTRMETRGAADLAP